MRIRRVTDASELKRLFQFRHSILVDELEWHSTKDTFLCDEFDRYAHNYIAYNAQGIIIGAMRLVYENPMGYPLERLFSLNDFRKGKRIIETCKFAIEPEYRSSRLFIYLLSAAYHCSKKLCCTHVVLDTYLSEESLYRPLGFKRISKPYRDPLLNNVSEVVTMSLELNSIDTSLLKSNPSLSKMLTTEHSIIDHGEIREFEFISEESAIY